MSAAMHVCEQLVHVLVDGWINGVTCTCMCLWPACVLCVASLALHAYVEEKEQGKQAAACATMTWTDARPGESPEDRLCLLTSDANRFVSVRARAGERLAQAQTSSVVRREARSGWTLPNRYAAAAGKIFSQPTRL